MKKINLVLILLALSVCAYAQGLDFAKGSWKDAVAQAKKEKKLLYVDFYTTWCGPCKVMAAQIFPQQAAGDKYNKLFVNYKIDAEKGEGIALAAKYKVKGYPTNLYIDPANETVVYSVMGSTDVEGFLSRADIAMMEKKDPMQWKDYEAKFNKGNRSKEFLIAFLEKAERLDKDNDKVLDAYVDQYVMGKANEENIKFLIKNTRTLDNKSIAFLAQNRELVNKLYADKRADYFSTWSELLPYKTLQKAIANKDQRLLKTIEEGIKNYGIKESGISGILYYRKEYYNQTGDDEAGWKASLDEANFISAMSASELDRLDQAQYKDVRASVLAQVKAAGATEDQYETSVEATLAKYPEMKKPATNNAAQSLNEIAWRVFERKQKDKQAVQMALAWSKRSLELTKGSSSWPMFADTYANLLYVNGDKQQAIAIQTEAVKLAKELDPETAGDLEETLKKMNSGE